MAWCEKAERGAGGAAAAPKVTSKPKCQASKKRPKATRRSYQNLASEIQRNPGEPRASYQKPNQSATTHTSHTSYQKPHKTPKANSPRSRQKLKSLEAKAKEATSKLKPAEASKKLGSPMPNDFKKNGPKKEHIYSLIPMPLHVNLYKLFIRSPPAESLTPPGGDRQIHQSPKPKT